MLLLASPTSYRVGAYREAAQSLEIDLLVGSDAEHSLVSCGTDGILVTLNDPDAVIEKILDEASRKPLHGVVAADDSMVELTSCVAAALGLPHNSIDAAKTTRRKDLGRQCLRAAGLAVPEFSRIDLDAEVSTQLHGVQFPCVAKPLDLSGSRGVIRANDYNELVEAVRRIRNILSSTGAIQHPRVILVEDYIPGPEIALEGLLHRGVLSVLAVFDKPDPLEGPFFEETYYITPSRHPRIVQRRIRETVARACRAYGLSDGPIHAEARLCDGKVWVLEIAARTIGGDCARLLQFGTGHSLEALVLAHAVQRPLDFEMGEMAGGVMMIPTLESGCLRRVEGVLDARRVEYVEDVVISVREGYELIPLPEGSSYLGFLFARATTPELVERALREAYAKLTVVVSPVWRLEPGATSLPLGPEIHPEDPQTLLPRIGSQPCVSR